MRSLKCLFATLAIGAVATTALAQAQPAQPPAPGQPAERPARPAPGRMPQLSAEKLHAAWELQATGVAKRLGVEDAKVKDVAKAYAEARTNQEAAMEKARKDMESKRDAGGAQPGPGGGRGAEALKAFDDVNNAERAKLQKALAAFMIEEKAAKAATSLGTFNRQWDNFADTIAGFKLEPAKQQDALNAIEDYVVAQSKLRGQVQGGDREAMRNSIQEARKNLSDSLKKVLTEDQLKQFEASMGAGMRGGSGGRGPGGGGGGGGGDDKGGGGK